jgi:hypothetical protein
MKFDYESTKQELLSKINALTEKGLEKYHILKEEFKKYRDLAELELKINKEIAF